MDGEVYSYSWLPTTSIWADILTKEMDVPSSLEDVIQQNKMFIPLPLENEGKDIQILRTDLGVHCVFKTDKEGVSKIDGHGFKRKTFGWRGIFVFLASHQ